MDLATKKFEGKLTYLVISRGKIFFLLIYSVYFSKFNLYLLISFLDVFGLNMIYKIALQLCLTTVTCAEASTKNIQQTKEKQRANASISNWKRNPLNKSSDKLKITGKQGFNKAKPQYLGEKMDHLEVNTYEGKNNQIHGNGNEYEYEMHGKSSLFLNKNLHETQRPVSFYHLHQSQKNTNDSQNFGQAVKSTFLETQDAFHKANKWSRNTELDEISWYKAYDDERPDGLTRQNLEQKQFLKRDSNDRLRKWLVSLHNINIEQD